VADEEVVRARINTAGDTDAFRGAGIDSISAHVAVGSHVPIDPNASFPSGSHSPQAPQQPQAPADPQSTEQ